MSKRAPKPPPPPPDYTKEKAAFAESEFANRKKQADAYNQAVNTFNQSLAGYRPQIDEFGQTVGGLGIADYTDGGPIHYRAEQLAARRVWLELR